MKRILKNQKGQSLVELLIAVGVITTGLVGTLMFAYGSLTAGKASSDRIIALNLLREGLEVSRNLRDDNWLAHKNFSDGFCDGSDCTSVSYFDVANKKWGLWAAPNNITDDSAKICLTSDNLYLQDGPSLLNCDSKPTTKYHRLITTTIAPDKSYMDILVQVSYPEGTGSKTEQETMRLYDWR
jgi:Tfp pilus assembly protein PilV